MKKFSSPEKIDDRIISLGISIPNLISPIANYSSSVISKNQLFISGQLPFVEGKLFSIGKIGKDVKPEIGKNAAKICGINILSQVKNKIKDLQNIKKIVKISVFVASDPEFYDISYIANGVSDLFYEIFGNNGRHARTSVGVLSLPMNSSVEVDAIIDIKL